MRLSREGLRIPSLPKSVRGQVGADGLCSATDALPRSRADAGLPAAGQSAIQTSDS